MFCRYCGTELPDEANFCLKCGKPQTPSVVVDEPKWETCRIVMETVKEAGIFPNSGIRRKGEYCFNAKGIGPDFSYSVGRSVMWNDDSRPEAPQEALKGLVNELLKDGWEADGHFGSGESDLQFRRRLR